MGIPALPFSQKDTATYVPARSTEKKCRYFNRLEEWRVEGGEFGKREKGVKVFQAIQAWNRVEQSIFNVEWENFSPNELFIVMVGLPIKIQKQKKEKRVGLSSFFCGKVQIIDRRSCFAPRGPGF